MIIIIDGYNLLKQIFPGAKRNLDKQKSAFVRQLALYKSQKSELTDIIVVFDAGPSNHATRTIKSGIVIIYSGVKSSADSWILNYVEQNNHKDLLVVTLDRALRNACQKMDADSIDVYEFYTILQNHLMQYRQQPETPTLTSSLEKYEPIDLENLQESPIDPEALDVLMEQAGLQIQQAKDDSIANQRQTKESPAHRLPKHERRLQAKIKKLH